MLHRVELSMNSKMTVDDYVTTHLADHFDRLISRGYAGGSVLTVNEQVIIYAYSSSYFRPVNLFLRMQANTSVTGFDDMLRYSELLAQVLAKLPPYQSIVYRGVNLISDEISLYRKAARTGETITEAFFVSTSRLKSVADKHGSVSFRIISKSGRDISNFSMHRLEAEVLFTYGNTFKVSKVDEQHDGRVVITLKEK